MSNLTPDAIYNSLLNLGLPRRSVTLDDFSCIYQHGGPLQDAILFISEHFRGRGGIHEARSSLLCASESGDESQINRARLPGKIAFSRLTKAKKDVEMYSDELHNEIKAAEEAQKHTNTLKSQLTAQRRVDLLLGILEKKENERIRRFEDISHLLIELKRPVIPYSCFSQSPDMEDVQLIRPFECVPSLSAPNADLNLKKPRQIQDALLVLNAYHVCLARLAAQSTQTLEAVQTTRDTRSRHSPVLESDAAATRNSAGTSVPVTSNNANAIVTPSASAEAQLRALVARKLGVEGGDKDPENHICTLTALVQPASNDFQMFFYPESMSTTEHYSQGFIEVAKARARDQVRYTRNLNIREPVSKQNLDTLAAEVNRKTQILQHASDLSLELACGTQDALGAISKFQKTTISSLEEILNSQLNSIRSYIDHLRIYVVADLQRDVQGGAQQGSQESESNLPNKLLTRVEPDFGHEVRKILGLREAETSQKVLGEIGRLVNTIRQKSQYFEAMQIRPHDLSSSQRARETETIASYKSQKQQIEDTIEKLLIRKIDKANSLGHSLVRDIEALLIGVKDIVGHGNSERRGMTAILRT
ncbi:hypothetical protein EV368DRAFT_83083 [Lentinula lateritia]|uniref:Uncharacterized protein n=1 Tax=Lentinula aff. lateritia TaxID=2804960 RepID=A0ACC1TTP7_9AGAR|nr:hypothetical protein F5876DRAFT_79247 [Lentinula aff. lateritia]KAJ3851886.1 hypothetical protein EV368DRAFT_83083 [Lentinula lateritia]